MAALLDILAAFGFLNTPKFHSAIVAPTQVESELYNPEEFEFVTGRCIVNGKNGTVYGATHKPSGKSRAVNSVEHQISNTTHRDLLDELVAELWHEKAS